MYNTMIPSVKDGDYWFGEIYVQGTAGDKDSDFEGAKKMMYNPKGYSLYAIPDVYDKVKQGKRNFVFFFPSYVNRKGCYNKDGVSDVTKAMIEILLDRYKIKYNSPDQSAITRTIAENPFTPAEAKVDLEAICFQLQILMKGWHRLMQIQRNMIMFILEHWM